MTTPHPGWYDDPHDSNAQRYWNGRDWTPHRQRKSTSWPTPPSVMPTQPPPPLPSDYVTQASGQVAGTPTGPPPSPPAGQYPDPSGKPFGPNDGLRQGMLSSAAATGGKGSAPRRASYCGLSTAGYGFGFPAVPGR